VIAALNKLGVQTTSFIAVLGAAGLAIGLALQGSLSNLSAGVILMVTSPFKIGDFIEAGGDSGTIKLLDLLATTLKTVDNKRVIIPNAKLNASLKTWESSNFILHLYNHNKNRSNSKTLLEIVTEHYSKIGK
jgi:small conductance mechanosensitive channel